MKMKTLKQKDLNHVFQKNAWGFLTSLDLYNCNPEIINNSLKLNEFIQELLKLLEMRAYGEPQIVYFGQEKRVEGYSLVQLIETSSITGHFAFYSNAAYLDIFSCKLYDPDKAAEFCKNFFQAQEITVHTTNRY